MVEYITLHMGSANNCYPKVFLDVFLFSISSFNMDNALYAKPFVMGVLARTKVVLVKNISFHDL